MVTIDTRHQICNAMIRVHELIKPQLFACSLRCTGLPCLSCCDARRCLSFVSVLFNQPNLSHQRFDSAKLACGVTGTCRRLLTLLSRLCIDDCIGANCRQRTRFTCHTAVRRCRRLVLCARPTRILHRTEPLCQIIEPCCEEANKLVQYRV